MLAAEQLTPSSPRRYFTRKIEKNLKTHKNRETFFCFLELQVKVIDTEGKPISEATMNYKNEKNEAQTAITTDTDGDLSADLCHGQILKDVEFYKPGFCKFKQDLEIEESPSYFLQVALRKEISNSLQFFINLNFRAKNCKSCI